MLLLFLQHSPCYTWKNRHVQVELSRNAAAEAQVEADAIGGQACDW